MAANHLKRKLRTYQALYYLNREFGLIRQQLLRLQHAGFLKPEKLEVFHGLALELQSQISHDVCDRMHSQEDDDMFRYGRVRLDWEHHLNPARPPFNPRP